MIQTPVTIIRMLTRINLCFFPDECGSCSGETDGTGTVIDNDLDNDGFVMQMKFLDVLIKMHVILILMLQMRWIVFFSEVYYNCDGVCLNEQIITKYVMKMKFLVVKMN